MTLERYRAMRSEPRQSDDSRFEGLKEVNRGILSNNSMSKGAHGHEPTQHANAKANAKANEPFPIPPHYGISIPAVCERYRIRGMR